MTKPIRVLVVDDSRVICERTKDLLHEAPDIEVVGTAHDGQDAIDQVATLDPDVVTLDVMMPKMDGLDALERILAERPQPVIMVSGLTKHNADATLKSLERGALDYLTKPENAKEMQGKFGDELVRKIRMAARTDVRRVLRVRRERAARLERRCNRTGARRMERISSNGFGRVCIAIGISTGGPPALSSVFAELHGPMPPIVVVQHMPRQFTSAFAARLNDLCELEVKEAAPGDRLRPNLVLVARGGSHLRLRRTGSIAETWLDDGPPVSGHRPSVDVMMRDVAAAFGSRAIGVIMTGMGFDGAAGCRAIREAGGVVFGQNKETSDVYGMNKVAFVQGNVDRQFALPDLASILSEHVRSMEMTRATRAVRT